MWNRLYAQLKREAKQSENGFQLAGLLKEQEIGVYQLLTLLPSTQFYLMCTYGISSCSAYPTLSLVYAKQSYIYVAAFRGLFFKAELIS